jgi:hypothetical protein
VPVEIWDAAESLASNDAGKVLAVGNPTDPNFHFAEVCKPGSGWQVHRSARSTRRRTQVSRSPRTCLRTSLARLGWQSESRCGAQRPSLHRPCPGQVP